MKAASAKKRGRKISKSGISLEDILQALPRVRAALPVTPLSHSPGISEITGRKVSFKWDNKLKTGSFKERGAVNCLIQLSKDERRRGVCAASAGNHALALSYHAARLKIPCSIVMPVNAPLVKVESTEKTGAHVILQGQSFDEAYATAQDIAKKKGFVFVSAFDDERIIAGQGTAGLEILDQADDFDSVIVPVGGGGLISGIATAIKATRPTVTVIGVQSEWAVHARSNHKAVAPIIAPVTIADGIAVKRIGSITGPIVSKVVDKLVTVNEHQIARGIIAFLEVEKTVVEGAGAAGLAALLEGLIPAKCKRPVVMACGSNIDMNVLSRLIEKDMGARGRLLRMSISVPDRPGSLRTLAGIIAVNGANVLQIYHERSFSSAPGNVEITFVAEVRNADHKRSILKGLKEMGLEAKEV